MRVKRHPGHKKKGRQLSSDKEMLTNDWKISETNEKPEYRAAGAAKGSEDYNFILQIKGAC